jgi:acetate kinase
MIQHVVMWKIKEFAEEKNKTQLMESIQEQLQSLKPKISEIRSLSVGHNIVAGNAAWDVCLVTTFDSIETLRRYQVHPEHQIVAAFIGKAASERAVVDFEIAGNGL